jgi:hypothetical protein
MIPVTLENLKEYKSTVMLKKAATSFIVSNLLSSKDLRTLQGLFTEYDTDKNGTLDM